jgi:ribose transport system substrate-binding protein
MIQQAIANPNTGGILIYPADPVAVAPALKEAMAKGIAVVAGNGDVPDKSTRNAFVGTDNKALGAAAADLVAKALGPNGGKVGIVSFISQLTHKHRVQGFEARIKAKYPKIKVIGIAPEDGTPQQEANAAGAFLQAHPDVNLLWTTDAGSGIVADQIKQQGKAGKVLAVGTDRTTEQLDAIRDGRVYATIVQDTYNEEAISLKYLYQLHNKIVKKLPDTTITKAVVITKANVGKLK